MKNLGDMMRKAQEVQQRLADMQGNLATVEISGQAGGGMVQVLMSGKGEARRVTLDPKVVDPSDVAMLEDLLVAAFNDAHGKVTQHVEGESQKIMGGISMPPGFKLPF
jgi:DNA-binding YbaB/EbfC family protein